jgi:hypothetical protein
MTPSHKVELISEAEAESFLRRLKESPENRTGKRSLLFPFGLEVKGEFSLIARDAKSGEIEWEHSQPNLLTDIGRRFWMENRFSSFRLGFCPSTEAPNSGRYSISTDPTANATFVTSTNLTPTNAPATNTKTVSTTFTAPASNRTLGMIAVIGAGITASVNMGLFAVQAYAILTPPKTQSTTQTLEVVYKISMNPIA